MASLDTLRERNAEIRGRLEEINAAAAGERFTEEQKNEWNSLNDELEGNREHITELEARMERIEALADRPESREEPVRNRSNVKRSRVPDDPTDLLAYRQMANNIDDLEEAHREGALRLTERLVPADHEADRERSQARMEHLIRHVDHTGEFARRVIQTSSSTYMRAFGKVLAGSPLTPEEQRAASLSSASGGYAVPVTLDPTVILTSPGRINPIRSLARVETITGTIWNGVSSTGITAGYAAEATEASDNAPTLAQPTGTVEKAFAFVPFSIEIGQDWGALQSEMARMFGEAKEDVESTKFLTGLGHGSTEPQGLIAVGGYTAVVTSATTATMAAADVYSLVAALTPRPRSRGVFLGNLAAYQKVRQFDTSGGANLWVQLAYDEPATLLGYPAYEWSAYSAATTTSGSTVLSFGDPSKFIIVDRVGMDVEVIQHLFATANNRPSGQRGLYAYWRNTTVIATPTVLNNSAFVSLKLL